MTSIFRKNVLFDLESYGAWKRDSVLEVDIVTGSLLMIDKKSWDRLEGFDPQFFMYGEDALCLRAAGKGARLEAQGIRTDTRKIEIGDGTSIHNYFHCSTTESVKIGKNVLIAGRVYITDHDHTFDNKDIPPIKAGLTISSVVIADEVWIGEGAVILKGVIIGKRAVIGANAVVTKNVPANAIAGWVPAKIIRFIDFKN